MSTRQPSQLLNPHNERVRKLSERLHSIQVSFDSEKVSRIEQLEKKFISLEDQIAEFHQQTEQKLGDLRERVSALQKSTEADRVHKEVQLDAIVRDLEGTEARLMNFMENDQGTMREAEMRIMKALDERTASFRSELVKETKAKSENFEYLGETLSAGLGRSDEANKVAKSDFLELQASVFGKLEDDCTSLSNQLLVERTAREDTEEAMLAMLKDVVGRIKSDLELERRDREITEENLLTLLEDGCAKLSALTQR